MDVLAWLLGGIGGAVVGALTTAVIASRRDSRERARAELVKLQGEVVGVHESVAVLQAQLANLTGRVGEAVRRIDTERNHQ